jgi:3-oxoacyl-(acyl-carrier-protein) synthase
MIRPYRPQVVVTGVGLLAPNGNCKQAFWQSLLERRSGIGPITLFDASELKCRVAGEIKNFDAANLIGVPIKIKRYARHTLFAIAAARMALEDAGLIPINGEFEHPVPIAMGVSSSAFDLIETGMTQMLARGSAAVSPFVVNASPPQAATSAIGEVLGIPAEGLTVSTGCPSGLDAVSAAVDMIRSDRTDLALAGGADAPITPLAFATFVAASLASTSNLSPERTSRPYDRDRDTGVISEGAGVLVLEGKEAALARGADPYIEIIGYATNMDRKGDEAGTGLEDTMLAALANAGHRAEDIDWICGHGPGHPVLDRVETAMIKKVFGKRAYELPVSSIKGATGNPLAAAGPLQLATCALAVHSGIIPPTTNLENPDPACDLDYVAEGPRHAEVNCCLLNIHGIGGVNSSMVVRKVL